MLLLNVEMFTHQGYVHNNKERTSQLTGRSNHAIPYPEPTALFERCRLVLLFPPFYRMSFPFDLVEHEFGPAQRLFCLVAALGLYGSRLVVRMSEPTTEQVLFYLPLLGSSACHYCVECLQFGTRSGNISDIDNSPLVPWFHPLKCQQVGPTPTIRWFWWSRWFEMGLHDSVVCRRRSHLLHSFSCVLNLKLCTNDYNAFFINHQTTLTLGRFGKIHVHLLTMLRVSLRNSNVSALAELSTSTISLSVV